MDKNRLSVSVFHGYNSIGMKRAFQALPTVNSERPKEESKRMKRISGNLQTDLNALREAADSYNALQNKFRSVGTEI